MKLIVLKLSKLGLEKLNNISELNKNNVREVSFCQLIILYLWDIFFFQIHIQLWRESYEVGAIFNL